MNNTLIIVLLVATLLIGALLFLSVEQAPGPESTIPAESRPGEKPPAESTGAASLTAGSAGAVFPVATVDDLLQYPDVARQEGLSGHALYAVRLPQAELVVVLRPITESEYGSFQVRAIGYEIIEQQMLTAAIVLPVVDEADVAGFPPELVTFLRQKVNEISGFDVF